MNNKLKSNDWLRWTIKEKSLLSKLFPTISMKQLSRLLKRTQYSVAKMSNKMKLKRQTQNYLNILGDVSVLLNESLETYYWIGFIMADGHISKKNELKISLSSKDIRHLRKLQIFLKMKKMREYTMIVNGILRNYCELRIMDNYTIPKIKEKFQIHNQKTYNPPDITVFKRMSDEKFIAFFIGLVDGDGNIKYQTNRDDCIMQFGYHYFWKKTLRYFIHRLINIYEINANENVFRHEDMARFSISNNHLLIKIKKDGLEYNLPFLNRKWDKININRIFFTEERKKNILLKKSRIEKLILKNYSKKQICKIEHISMEHLSNFLNTYKITRHALYLKPLTRTVLQLDVNGNILRKFSSLDEAANYVKRVPSAISNMIRGDCETCAGFKWEYSKK